MMEEAEMVSDRLAIINKGKVVAEGKPNEIKRLVKERYRIVIEGEFDGLQEYGEVMNLGDKHIVYVKSEDAALQLLKDTLKKGLRAEASPITLEDVFVKLVGGTED
jgi:ABC-2 type transport system ATP-binding protein